MDRLTPRLKLLVDRLDRQGVELSLVGIADTLKGVSLSSEDVSEFVVANQMNYNRALVTRNDRYELLVMTWLPGQSSVPHDHSGSICALQVIQGEATESSYRQADDGYVDLDFESVVNSGGVSAGQDAGIHSIKNFSSSETLVTVHVYAPPLREFRRFVNRPTKTVQSLGADKPVVAVIGGGFSGAMTAAQLMRRGSGFRVVLIERRGAVAEGIAYGTQEDEHLLNVPAARMSAWPDRPDDFLNWAKSRRPDVQPNDFLPRRLYGEYVRETLHQTAEQSGSESRIVLEEARRVARHPDGGWVVHFDRGNSLHADAAVLAIGHRPPTDPLREVWRGPRSRFIADPWVPFATAAIPADEPVAILGAGLTAVDVVLSLNRRPRSAPLTLISRNGLLPQTHAKTPAAAVDMTALVNEFLASAAHPKILYLARAVQGLARERIKQGGDWRSVVDGLRPHTAKLWRALDTKERRKFLSRLRPFWEVHRHRMASDVAQRLEQLKHDGLVNFVSGQVVNASSSENEVSLTIRRRGGVETTERRFGRVVNCTGPSPSNSAEANPVIGSLLVHNWVRRDPLALGLDAAEEGNAIASDGSIVPDLWIIGTLRKPQFWESTAVPELRTQAAEVANKILQLLTSRAKS